VKDARIDDAVSVLCRKHTGLTGKDIASIASLATHLPVFSALDNTDVFIDCLQKDGVSAVVVAEAHPNEGQALYAGSVAGKQVLPDNEPAVFHAFLHGAVRDILGVTQEKRSVRQSVVPLRNEAGTVIAVLIQERDVSDDVDRDRRYARLAQVTEEQKEILSRYGSGNTVYLPEPDALVLKETHHRVKNNLQLIASMLGLQARNSVHTEVRTAFTENIGRILSIASVYDVLSIENHGSDEKKRPVQLIALLEKVCYTVLEYSSSETCRLRAEVSGDDIPLDGDRAVHIALVVNELVTNAVKHAFAERNEGVIQVKVRRGNSYSSIVVEDDGRKYNPPRETDGGLGMHIVRALVTKLGGTLRIESEDNGNRTTFDFLENK
jgi:Signal transduction histidine kinase